MRLYGGDSLGQNSDKKRSVSTSILYRQQIQFNDRNNNCVLFEHRKRYFSIYLEIRSIILGDVRAVTLRQHHNLLLYILDLIFRLFKIDDLNGNNLLSPVVDTFENLAEATFPDSFLFCKYQLGVNLLQQKNSRFRLLLWSFDIYALFTHVSRHFRKKLR